MYEKYNAEQTEGLTPESALNQEVENLKRFGGNTMKRLPAAMFLIATAVVCGIAAHRGAVAMDKWWSYLAAPKKIKTVEEENKDNEHTYNMAEDWTMDTLGKIAEGVTNKMPDKKSK